MWLLRDPLQLTDYQLIMTAPLAQMLIYCDGTRTPEEIHAAFCQQMGGEIGFEIVTDALAQLEAPLVDFLKKNGEISIPQFKDLTQTSRKFTIPLLEYFDMNRVTVRVGEARRLREGV